MDKIYYLGLVKGIDKGLWSNNHKKSTVILEARQDKDFLSCELWKYIGARIITKRKLNANKLKILEWINKEFNSEFMRLIID